MKDFLIWSAFGKLKSQEWRLFSCVLKVNSR